METIQQIKELFGEIGFQSENIGLDDSLVDEGIIDSLTILELITALESKFSIEFDESDYDIENFASIKSIERTVHQKITK